MTRLSVNVNKLATLRNARGKNNPDLVRASQDIVGFGAHGITVHPRPDGRHIRPEDVFALKRVLKVELNVEGYPSSEFLSLIRSVRPAQCTLVPDPPEALTSNAGWDLADRGSEAVLKKAVSQIKSIGETRVSVFMDPFSMKADENGARLVEMGVDRIELFTEAYADSWGQKGSDVVLGSYVRAAEKARHAGLAVNAGHDLNIDNLTTFVQAIPWTAEVSIGHALICDALYDGLSSTVQKYLGCLALAVNPHEG